MSKVKWETKNFEKWNDQIIKILEAAANKLNVDEEVKEERNKNPLEEVYKLKEKINSKKFKTKKDKVEIINFVKLK